MFRAPPDQPVLRESAAVAQGMEEALFGSDAWSGEEDDEVESNAEAEAESRIEPKADGTMVAVQKRRRAAPRSDAFSDLLVVKVCEVCSKSSQVEQQ